ncbi:MAG: TetR/AcrR family transcriptional regulator [Phormidesmis sp.]
MGALTANSLSTQSKQAQILKGALTIFLQRGYEGTSMDRVAAAAGVSKITIYKYFEGKEGLFTALIEQVTSLRFQVLFGTLSLADPPDVVLRQVATKLLDMLADDEEYVDFLRLIIGESGRFPALAQLFVKSLPQKVWATLEDYFDAHPELELKDSAATARIFMGTLISFVLSQRLLHGEAIAPISEKAVVDSLIDLIVG